MIDIKLIRENPKLVKDNIKKKKQLEKIKLVDKIKKDDEEWRKLKFIIDSLRKERNQISKKISEAKKSGESIKDLMIKAKDIPNKIKKTEDMANNLYSIIINELIKIPNIISKHTPINDKNKIVRKHGKIPKFNYNIKNHVEILENLGIVDFDKSSQVSGNGFYYLKNELALLNQALIRFTIDYMNKKKYEYIETPLMLHEKEIYASMDREAIEESVYSIGGEDLNLIGTAEQSLLSYHASDTLKESELPKKYFSYSMCFRKEIGSHGINEKGLWRTHQFNKVEQFIFCKPEDSEKLYEELLKNSEEILKLLELPYRILEMSSIELADWKHRYADIEVYRPTIKEYGEVMSLSNCTDYQARKLNIKVIDKHGNREILHTLNNTAMATSRILVTLIENNQTKEGNIKIPKVLHKYTGFKEIKKN